MVAEKKSATSTRTSSKKTSSPSGEGDSPTAQKGSSRARAPRAEPRKRLSAGRIAVAAARQLAELTTKDVEGVTALQRTDEGWLVQLEVLELRRIPATTDVLAIYEVSMDSSGELEEYRRRGRFVRGQAEGEA
jgi:hypothetical protein